jgi:cytochrome c-type biogenesis protein CcmH/NrfG
MLRKKITELEHTYPANAGNLEFYREELRRVEREAEQALSGKESK